MVVIDVVGIEPLVGLVFNSSSLMLAVVTGLDAELEAGTASLMCTRVAAGVGIIIKLLLVTSGSLVVMIASSVDSATSSLVCTLGRLLVVVNTRNTLEATGCSVAIWSAFEVPFVAGVGSKVVDASISGLEEKQKSHRYYVHNSQQSVPALMCSYCTLRGRIKGTASAVFRTVFERNCAVRRTARRGRPNLRFSKVGELTSA